MNLFAIKFELIDIYEPSTADADASFWLSKPVCNYAPLKGLSENFKNWFNLPDDNFISST